MGWLSQWVQGWKEEGRREASGWKHKNLPELVSDGRTEKTGLSWKSGIWLVKTNIFNTFWWKPEMKRIHMGFFSTERFAMRSHVGSIFSKRVRKIGIPKIQKTSRILYFGSKTKIVGLWDHNYGQKSGPNKIKHVPGPRNSLKNLFLYIFWIHYIIISLIN